MTTAEILSLVVTIIGVFSFAAIFTILYRSYVKSSITEINTGKRDIELMNEVIYDQQINVKRRKKITGIIKTVIFYLLLILIIPTFVYALISKFSGNVVMIGGKSIMVVASGSMSFKDKENEYVNDPNLCNQYIMDNQFKKYDLITIKKVKSPSDLHLYDVIAFKSKDGQNIIHRVVGMEESLGTFTYITQGDARPKEDGMHPKFEDVIGVYTNKKVKSLGMFVMFFQSYAGMITIISLIYCLLMIDRINSKINDVENERLEKLYQVLDYKPGEDVGEVTSEFYECIHYNGYIYRFNDFGFVDKTEDIKKEPLNEENNEDDNSNKKELDSSETIDGEQKND